MVGVDDVVLVVDCGVVDVGVDVVVVLAAAASLDALEAPGSPSPNGLPAVVVGLPPPLHVELVAACFRTGSEMALGPPKAVMAATVPSLAVRKFWVSSLNELVVA